MAVELLEHQSGIIRILLYLLDHGQAYQMELADAGGMYDRIVTVGLAKLESLGLVRRWVDENWPTPKKMSALTDKGIKVAEKLKEIDILLTGK